jgi:predicted permease
MKTLRAMLARFAGLFRRSQQEADMNEEMRAHVDGLIERNLAAGMSPDDARYAALRTFGGVAQIAERARDERRSAWVENIFQDLRYAARALRKSPSFTVTAVLTLAFGIGVNAALFTIYNAVALHSLPVRNPAELVTFTNHTGFTKTFSHPDYLDFREGNRTLAGLAAWSEGRMELAAGPGAPPGAMSGVVKVNFVSENYLRVLGASLRFGRGFLDEENRTPETHPVLVLSHAFWEQRWQSDPAVIGRTVTLNGQPYTIVGVAAPEFVGHPPMPPVAWIPLMMRPEGLTDRTAARLRLFGRLKPGVSVAAAKTDLDRIAAELARLHSRHGRDAVVRLEPGMQFLNLPLSPQLFLALSPLFLGFAMVFIIACTNVVNLLLARGITRQQEIGMRFMLGASRGRILRQLLTENLLLCALAAAVGLPLAVWALQLGRTLIVWSFPAELQPSLMQIARLLDFSPDLRVALFTAVVALVAGLAAGLMPALQAVRTDLMSTLKSDGSAFGRRVSQSRLRNLLVVAQVAVCLMLLSCAGLLVRNLIKLQGLDLGCEPGSVFTVELTDARDAGRFSTELRHSLELLRALPDIAGACAFRGNPLFGAMGTTVSVPASPEVEQRMACALVSAGFFETLGISLSRGRGFTPREVEAATRTVVLSEAAAARLWPGADPLGKIVGLRDPTAGAAGARRDYEVIGIARDVRNHAFERDTAFIYFPLPPDAALLSAVCIRPRQDSGAALAAIVAQARAAGVPLRFRDRLMKFVEIQSLPIRGLAWLSGILGALALLMAAVGLYGVMAFAVNQRVREIGIRVALGAPASRVVGLFVRQGMKLVTIGAVFGLMGGTLFALLLRRVMFGLGDAFDPIAFGAVTVLLAAVALLACWLPARRATKVDPMVALRAE